MVAFLKIFSPQMNANKRKLSYFAKKIAGTRDFMYKLIALHGAASRTLQLLSVCRVPACRTIKDRIAV
jgi:hypothetical protein